MTTKKQKNLEGSFDNPIEIKNFEELYSVLDGKWIKIGGKLEKKISSDTEHLGDFYSFGEVVTINQEGTYICVNNYEEDSTEPLLIVKYSDKHKEYNKLKKQLFN